MKTQGRLTCMKNKESQFVCEFFIWKKSHYIILMNFKIVKCIQIKDNGRIYLLFGTQICHFTALESKLQFY